MFLQKKREKEKSFQTHLTQELHLKKWNTLPLPSQHFLRLCWKPLRKHSDASTAYGTAKAMQLSPSFYATNAAQVGTQVTSTTSSRQGPGAINFSERKVIAI